MCRFVVYRGRKITLRTVVYGGTHSLVEQAWDPRELLVGHTNADGYGIVWYHQGRPIRIARREPVWYDPDLEALLEIQSARTVLASLRNATPGMSIAAGGLAPLVRGEWSFILNGFVHGFHDRVKRVLHEGLSNELYREMRDGSDTETLFLTALQAVREGAGPAAALEHVIRLVRELIGDGGEGGAAQLNMVLSGPGITAVSRASSVEATNSLYLARSPGLAPDGILVASERLDGDGAWERVPPQSLLEIDSDGDLRRLDIPL